MKASIKGSILMPFLSKREKNQFNIEILIHAVASSENHFVDSANSMTMFKN